MVEGHWRPRIEVGDFFLLALYELEGRVKASPHNRKEREMTTYDEIKDYEPTAEELKAIESESMPDWAWDDFEDYDFII